MARSEPASSGPAARPGESVAAVDLGSNSFHMIIAECRPEGLLVVDRLREMVQLGAGLGRDGHIDAAAQERALRCLRRFGERLSNLHARQVRAVGTNALRKAQNTREFLARAEAEFGHPIHVISGAEEARLIYAGVGYTLPPAAGTRLVADIGGGSTEFIVGTGAEPDALASIAVGCVSLTERYFRDGGLGGGRLAAARAEALHKLEPVAGDLSPHAWAEAVGASGSIRAVASVGARLGMPEGEISRGTIRAIAARLEAAPDLGKADLPGLSAERRPIFPGGFVILAAIFELLGLERMQVAAGALREGLLLDLVGRLSDRDVREASVAQLAARFRVGRAQAARVAATARRLYEASAGDWVEASAEHAKLLDWAARLHEVGLAIGHPGYHRHGAYVLEHAEMAGFSRDEQRRLALIVAAQRKRFPRRSFRELPPGWRRPTRHLAVLLRLAVVMNRGRAGDGRLPFSARVNSGRLELVFPGGWLDAHPLMAADLARESDRLAKAGYEVEVR